MNIDLNKSIYYHSKKDKETTKNRLKDLKKMGFIDFGQARFGVPDVCSGLYIEEVWVCTPEEWDDCLKWASQLIEKSKTLENENKNPQKEKKTN